jgi:hypothetical protein
MNTEQTNGDVPKNTPRDIMEHEDPAGTSPNRHATDSKSPGADYSQKPDNHTATADVMIESNRGE